VYIFVPVIIQRKQAQFYDNIMKELRPEPEYYRVAFYGRGFAHYLKVCDVFCPQRFTLLSPHDMQLIHFV